MATKRPRKPKEPPKTVEEASAKAIAGKRATVFLERCGLTVRVDDVDAQMVPLVATDLLKAFRVLAREYPELLEYPEHVPSSGPLEVYEDGWADEGKGLRPKRVGF